MKSVYIDPNKVYKKLLSLGKERIYKDNQCYNIKMMSSATSNLISDLVIENKIKKSICLKFERFIVEDLIKTESENNNFCFNTYFAKLNDSNWQEIFCKYPVLKKYFYLQKNNSKNQYLHIINSFIKDKTLLKKKGIIKSTSLSDISIEEGDFHNGKSTAILKLRNGESLVYKPRSGQITNAYNTLLDWLNYNKPFKDYKYEILDRGNYHWLQFINYTECESKTDLKKYYEYAGLLLCVTYILNASDFHYENIISKGATPILIDHETIIQPQISKSYIDLFLNNGVIEELDTVVNSFLLPYSVEGSYTPIGMSGFGCHKQIQMQSLSKVGINRFTKDWKIVMDYVNQPFYKQNIPKYNGKRIYPINYLNALIEGFETCYKIFMHQRKFFLGTQSPFEKFKNCKIRHIWRSTNTYMSIQNKMNLPKNLKNKKKHEQIVRKYLKFAFKDIPKNSKLWLIYEHEVAQMLRGDIPYFEVDTSSKKLYTENGVIEDFFELNSMENFKRKLNKLSLSDLNFQKQLIVKSLNT